MSNFFSDKSAKLYLVIAGFFVTNAIVAEFIGVKIFSLEATLGLEPYHWSLFGNAGTLQFSAGTVLWPVVFTITDLLNHYYGQRAVKRLSYFTVALILYGFIMVFSAISLAPADWWVGSYQDQGVVDAQKAYAAIFGQGLWIIAGSTVAFLIGQVLDAYIFHRIRLWVGEKALWFRALSSTFVSQFIDSFVVLYIAFVLGPQHWSYDKFFAIGSVNYGYKIFTAIILLPVLYLLHRLIDNYLGKERVKMMQAQAVSEL
jgi:queuosine precursor transporter